MKRALLIGSALWALATAAAQPTITSPTVSVTDPGNGSTTSFAYNFLIPFQANGITPAVTVQVLNVATDVLTPVAPGAYSIAGAGNPLGGTVTYAPGGVPLAVGFSLVITRSLAYTQPIAVPNFSFYPHTVEVSADNLEAQIQQLAAMPVSVFNPTGVISLGGLNLGNVATIPNVVDGLATFDGVSENWNAQRATAPEYGQFINMTSAVGSGSFLYYKVADGVVMTQNAGSSDAFAANFVLQRNAGVATTSGMGLEIDLGNNDQDYTSNIYPYVANLYLTGAGSHVATCAICVNYGPASSNYMWTWGIIFSGSKAVGAATIEDDTSSPTSFAITGTHSFNISMTGSTASYGIDEQGATLSNAFRAPNNVPIVGRNSANNADVSIALIDTGGNVQIGQAGATGVVLGGGNTVPTTVNGRFRPASVTFASLGTVDGTPAVGDQVVITDASACTANAAVAAGGGTIHACPVVYNGTGWIALVTH
jgi:hypothetical protein